jgi:translation initiation factor 1A
MPKKNTKGGKKHKQLKNSNVRQHIIDMTIKDSSGYQYYAMVEKYYGHDADVKFIKVINTYENNDKNLRIINSVKELISCKAIIRGTIAKKCKLTTGDVLLISIRDYDPKKVDVIYKYSSDELKELISNNEFDEDFTKLLVNIDSQKNKNMNYNDIINSDIVDDILFKENIEEDEDDNINDEYDF